MTTKRFQAGIITGKQLSDLFEYAKSEKFALPAVNVTGTMNAVLETAREVGSPVIIQFSNSGASLIAGKTLSNDGQKASILGAISGAKHVHLMAESTVLSCTSYRPRCKETSTLD